MGERIYRVEPALESFLVPIETLRRDPENARRHDERSVRVIAASLARFRQQKPIVINPDGIVKAGNGTFLAALHLGWTHIAATTTTLEGPELNAYAFVDNKSYEISEWEDAELRRLGSELDAAGIDLLAFGFTEQDLAALAATTDAQPPETFPGYDDDIPVEHRCPNCGYEWSGKPKAAI